MRTWKWRPPPYRSKSPKTSTTELQAMETLKKRISNDQNPTPNFLSILIDSFKISGSSPNPSSYRFITNHLLNRRLVSHLPPIIDHLEKAETFEVEERFFANLIKGYGRCGEIRAAVDLFFRIPRFRCSPSAVSLNPLLSILCETKEGLRLVPDVLMKAPAMKVRLEASSFRILISGLCRNGSASASVELLNMMEDNECSPNAGIYSFVLRSLCQEMGSSPVLGFLEEIRKAGFFPTVADYNCAIGVLVREGKHYDACSILSRMKSDGRVPDVVSYNCLMDGFISANEFQNADDLFDEMLLMGVVPNAASFNSCIHGFCKRGDFERGQRMVVCMERLGFRPDAETFNTLIDGYVKFGKLEIASQVLMDMFGKGFAPRPLVFKDLLLALCKKGLISEAIQLLEEMTDRYIAPSVDLWEALLNGFKLQFEEGLICLEDIIGPSAS